METVLNIYNSMPEWVGFALNTVLRLVPLAFIFFKSKSRNEKQRPFFYVLTFIVPLIGVIVYLVKHKETGGDNMNKCPVCDSLYPPQFTHCHKCNVELPEYNEAKQRNLKNISTSLLVIFGICSVFFFCLTIIGTYSSIQALYSDDAEVGRMGYVGENGEFGYYDAKGKYYSEPEMVVLYAKDGTAYKYNNAAEGYVSSDGKTIVSEHNAYVDLEGNFVEVDGDDITSIGVSTGEKGKDGYEYYGLSSYYFENQYVDSAGNKYYPAYCASWTENGQFIDTMEEVSD